MPQKNIASNKDKTIRRILEGATKVFAEAGYSGASVDEIAKAANVNKATIYYHVGDKEALYVRVLHEVIGQTAAGIAGRMNSSMTPAEKLATYVSGIAQTVASYPPLPPVMMRAVESGGQILSPEVAADLMMIFGILLEILEQGAREGVFIKSNPFIIYLMIIGAVAFHRNVEANWDQKPELAMLFKQMDPDFYQKLEGSFSASVASEVTRLLLRALEKQEGGK